MSNEQMRIRELKSLTIVSDDANRRVSIGYVTSSEYRQRAEAIIDDLASEVLEIREKLRAAEEYAEWSRSTIATLTRQKES